MPPFRMKKRSGDQRKYTADIDPKTRAEITLAVDNVPQGWHQLAVNVEGIDTNDMFALKRTFDAGRSPTEHLLCLMDRLNKKISYLYRKLMETRHIRAARLLEQSYIPENERIEEDEIAEINNHQNPDQLDSLVPPDSEYDSMESRRSFPSGSCQPPSQHPSLCLSLNHHSNQQHGGHQPPDYVMDQQIATDSWRQNLSYQRQHQEPTCRPQNPHIDGLLSNNLESMQLNEKYDKKKSVVTDLYRRQHLPHDSSGYPYYQHSSVRMSREPTESPDQDCAVPDSQTDTHDMLATDIQTRNNLSGSTSSNTGSSNNASDVGSSDGRSRHSSALDLLLQYSITQIEKATSNFSPENFLGEGSYGKVYRGTLGKTSYAIKVFKEEVTNQDEATRKHVMNEIESLAKFRHENIVQLCGFCDVPKLCLVYNYMINGSLADKLACRSKGGQKKGKPLSWPQRSNILRGTAKAIFFLHDREPAKIHGDIKSSNILLDKNLEPKLADFGLARTTTGGSTTGILTHVTRKTATQAMYGSRSYLPQEFLRDHKYNVKTDVFSFGVVILEVCTGKPAESTQAESREVKYLYEEVHDARNIDMEGDEVPLFKMKDKVAEDWPDELWRQVALLGCLCTEEKKKQRPRMKEVVEKLENIEVDYRKQMHENLEKKSELGNGEPSSVCQDPSLHVESEPSIHKNQGFSTGQSLPYELQKEYDSRKESMMKAKQEVTSKMPGENSQDCVKKTDDSDAVPTKAQMPPVIVTPPTGQPVNHTQADQGQFNVTAKPVLPPSVQASKSRQFDVNNVIVQEGHIREGESEMDDMPTNKTFTMIEDQSVAPLTLNDRIVSRPRLPIPLHTLDDHNSKIVSEREEMVNKYRNKKMSPCMMQHRPGFIQPPVVSPVVSPGMSPVMSPGNLPHIYTPHPQYQQMQNYQHYMQQMLLAGQEWTAPPVQMPPVGQPVQPQYPPGQVLPRQRHSPQPDNPRQDGDASLDTSNQSSLGTRSNQSAAADSSSSSACQNGDRPGTQHPPVVSPHPQASQGEDSTPSSGYPAHSGSSSDAPHRAESGSSKASSLLPGYGGSWQAVKPPSPVSSEKLTHEDGARIGLGEQLMYRKKMMEKMASPDHPEGLFSSNTSAE